MGTLDPRESSSVLLQGTIQCTFTIPVLLGLISAHPRDCSGAGKQISLMYHWSLSCTERQSEKRHNAVVYLKCLSVGSYPVPDSDIEFPWAPSTCLPQFWALWFGYELLVIYNTPSKLAHTKMIFEFFFLFWSPGVCFWLLTARPWCRSSKIFKILNGISLNGSLL